MVNFRSLLIPVLFLTTGQSFAQKSITLEMIWRYWMFQEEYVWGLNNLNDGEHYSSIMTDPETGDKQIIQYDYKNGEAGLVIYGGEDMSNDDQVKAYQFNSYVFSPDEKQLLLSYETEPIYRYSEKANYQVYNRATGKYTNLSNLGKQMYPSFTPDGQKVAYVVNNNLYYRDIQAGKEVSITSDGESNKIINGASDWVYEEELEITQAYAWSPDGSKLAYLRFDESEVPQFSMPIYKGLYPSNYTFKYPKAGEANSKVTLHIYDLKTGKTRDIDLTTLHSGEDDEDVYIPRMEWTTDPNLLSVQRMNRHQDELELLLINAKSGAAKKILKLTDKYYLDVNDNLTFLKDGKHFIWTSESDGYNHIYLYDMNGTLVRQITKGTWEVTDFYGVDEESGLIYYQSTEQSPLQRHVYSIGINGKNKKLLTPGPGTHEVQFSKTFDYGIHYHSTANSPTRITVVNNKMKVVRVLEENEALKEAAEEYGFPDKEFFTFNNEEGVTLNGYMYKPKDFDPSKAYPVFMHVYGGPGSQRVADQWGGRNDLWFQMLTQMGYIVVTVDNRGTGGRGAEFKKMTYLNLGKYEVADQISAAKYLGKQSYIDKDRIGIFGWSYGGYMSSLALFMAPDVFKMAIAVAPVSHWKFYDTIYTERFMRTPEENEEGYESYSPINHVGNMEGAYLLVHGSADDNVHFQNSMELANALIAANKDFDFFVYPDRNHGIYGANARLHLYRMMTEFIQENL